ncbi:protein DpdE [Nocardia salmonicida]|uniref:protein DpdE n=1 Tax=Nocardia salmonicida TaxID=53431 RepID=UPI0033D3873E
MSLIGRVEVAAGTFVLHQSIPGIGRVAERNGNMLLVEAFDSVANPVAQAWWLPTSECRTTTLGAETRVFWRDPDDGTWAAGRVSSVTGDTCLVRFPNGGTSRVHLIDLRVRWDRPVTSPVEVLASGANESPYYRDARLPMLHSLVKQRAACASFPAILSSAVEAYPHQIAAALTVLRDPVQRYLFADEVGLGKTIEAGLVIRQNLLDNPNARIAVIVPGHLRRQWAEELRSKFFIDDFPACALRISAHETPGKWRNYHGFDLVVVDEAHALTQVTDPETGSYRELSALAHSVPRLLLLSATPAVANPEFDLALLHLLDPNLYRWEERQQFVRQFKRRRTLAEAVNGLTDEWVWLLGDTIETIRAVLPQDPRFETLACRVTALSDDSGELRDDAGASDLKRALAELRAHIGETYRLDRRIIRHRRATVIGSRTYDMPSFEVTGRQRPRSIRFGLNRAESAAELLLEWQQRVAEWLLDHPANVEIDDRPTKYGRVLSILVSRVAEISDDLLSVLRWRVNGDAVSRHRADLCEVEAGALTIAPVLPFESEILARVENLTSGAVALDLVRSRLRPARRAVVFCGRGQLAADVADLLAEVSDIVVRERTKRLDQDVLDDQVEQWHRTGGVLVVDGGGEEGINLQDADLVVHLRLPWSPNLLEQRLGRVDRFAGPQGASGIPVTHLVDPMGTAEENFAAAWLELLRSGFGAFDDSLSALQDNLDDLRDSVWSVGLCEGPHAMVQQVSRVAEETMAYRRAVEVMDAVEAVEDVDFGQEIAKGINEIENDWRVFANQMRRFLSGEGGLRFEETEQQGGRVVEFDVNPRHAPLVSPALLARLLPDRMGLSTPPIPPETRRGAFNRMVAFAIPETRVFRLGNVFVDFLARIIAVDDRGQASALWRPGREHDHAAYFGFHLLAEADVDDAVEWGGEREPGRELALRRQADWMLRPFMGEVWLRAGSDEEVTDRSLLDWLRARYDQARDLNLNADRIGALTEAFAGVEAYASAARTAERVAVDLFTRREDVCAKAEFAYEEAQRTLGVQRAQAIARRAAGRLITDTDRYLADVGIADRIAAALKQPRIRVVSVTCVIGGEKMAVR